MNNMSLRHAAVCTLALLASACIPRHVPLDPEFFNSTPRKIGIILTKEPALGVYPIQPNQGPAAALVYLAIAGAAIANLETQMKTIDVSPLHELANDYIDKLNERGVAAKLVSRKRLAKIGLLVSPYKADLQWLASTEDVDAVILLESACGVTIRYPYTPVTVQCSFAGRLVDLKTGKLLWAANSDGENPLVTTLVEWNQPPDFPIVTKTIEKSIVRARQSMVTAFFEDNHAPRVPDWKAPPF